MYGRFFLKNETFSIFREPHFLQIVPCLFTHDVQTIFEHTTQDLLPNLDPHISQLVNWKNIRYQYVKMFYPACVFIVKPTSNSKGIEKNSNSCA